MFKHAQAAAVVLSITLLPASATAQGTTITVQEMRLEDGSRLYGTIEREDSGQIQFRTIGGSLITVARSEVQISPVAGTIVDGEFLPEDPNRTRLFFGPTGRALKKGDVYFGTYQFVVPVVQVGLTDRFSIGGGTPLIFGVDLSERPFYLTPKLQVINRDRVQASIGALHFSAGDDNVGLAYGVATINDSLSSLSIGGGFGYTENGVHSPVVMIGADRRMRRNLKVITENYVWEGAGIVSAGVRFIGDRLSADIGLAVPFGRIAGYPVYPVANFLYAF